MTQAVFPQKLMNKYMRRPPATATDYYPGNPEERKAARRQKLVQARHRRLERNLGLVQGTLPLPAEEIVATP